MRKFILLMTACCMLCSCNTYKRLAYLQDMLPSVEYESIQAPAPRIEKGDKVRIIVASTQPELAAPFNPYSYFEQSTSQSGSDSGNDYVVDGEGYIDFPVLGKVKVEGRTLDEVRVLMISLIKDTGYIKEPLVKAEFVNFEVTVLGEVHSPGVYSIPDGNVNLYEIIGKAGDLTEDAQRDRVMVIRTSGDLRRVYEVDTKSRSIYDSPAFHLQQNDMVYVAPVRHKSDKGAETTRSNIIDPIQLLVSIAMVVVWAVR